ncbi:MAG: hypothetical protein FWB78_09250 [Treponema sp.]|nr:hypothetical protein [Treponema sp.]
MNSGAEIDFRNPALIRKLGMAALEKELGAVGTAYFLRQFSQGQGDYTAEREKLLEGITLDEILKNVKELDKLHP